jgi:hypothetical protein
MRRIFALAAAAISLLGYTVAADAQDKVQSPSQYYTALIRARDMLEGRQLVPDSGADMEAAKAIGYLAGVADTLFAASRPEFRYCPTGPRDTLTEIRVVLAYADAHPKAYSMEPDIVIGVALQSAYPCNNDRR